MTSKKRPGSTAFHEAIAPPAERRAAGKALRTTTPRTSHAGWEPGADRPDPVEVLVESNRTRQQDLVPLRYARMAASPFAFLRGSALVMSLDLATQPMSGPEVMICGDAHISNFGLYASPERRLVFDLNDFDEACTGPFEFDLKRFAASIVVAGRERGLNRAGTSRLVVDAIGTYRDWMDRYGDMSRLDVYYARIDAEDLLSMVESDAARRRSDDFMRRVMGKNHLKAVSKLTTKVDGRWRIVPDPPIVTRVDNPRLEEVLDAALVQYHDSLPTDRQRLFEQYRFVDFARKVVGVGSVGTRCWIVLLEGPNGGPLFLQVKEARQAVPHLALGRPPAAHEGRRVVDAQRSLQAVSDILLGWTTGEEGVQYFVRQLWDAKGSFEIPLMKPNGFRSYVRLCAWALARAHARTGDPATIAGYVGNSDTLGEALAQFAEAYADQTERDHAALVAALTDGRLPSVDSSGLVL